ncbi:hypothetical protein RchiOBHm_Chr5g0080901 [Rosa chinensis]|uniref:Uncharacterized protein n=1 Tax=Rosa chinensis TaxID=74649 RepID=A0A2P6QMX1_ROSCH|nr:hypothetical protein RchiOBHm_Chr5g0080901 [Rosa chinensis]
MAPIRKYSSGAQKRKEKQKRDALVKLQAGSLSKYFNTNNKQAQTSADASILENEKDIEEHDQLMTENERA